MQTALRKSHGFSSGSDWTPMLNRFYSSYMTASGKSEAKPFLMAVNAVAFDTENRCLLLRRSTANKNFVGCWEWPGGKVDAGEDLRGNRSILG